MPIRFNRFSNIICRKAFSDPDAPADARPLSLWHLSHAAAPPELAFEVLSVDFVPEVMAGSLDPGAYSVEPDDDDYASASYVPPPSSEVKLSLPFSALAASTPNGVLAVHTKAPDHAELYSNTGLGYAELETVTPESPDSLSNFLIYFVRPAP